MGPLTYRLLDVFSVGDNRVPNLEVDAGGGIFVSGAVREVGRGMFNL